MGINAQITVHFKIIKFAVKKKFGPVFKGGLNGLSKSEETRLNLA
jgi:hypothetical protein